MNESEVYHALMHPFGTSYLNQLVKANEKIVIITSDITRPCLSQLIIPSVLDELYTAGCKPENISIVFALGSHRKQTADEKRFLVGETIWNSIQCIDSDSHDCLFFGYTDHGTHVEITRIVAEADRRICLGNIEYHYFAGYSGGAKAIMPGCASKRSIQANHSLMVHNHACAGRLYDNPLRQDIEQAASMVGIDFIVNVVLDDHKQIVHAFAGDVIEAHRDGCRFLDHLFLKPVDTLADIVIVSQGGFPKDINLYQTQKALDNAKHAVKPGGTIILIGSCAEGMGNRIFGEWLLSAPTSHSIIERIEQDFQLGGHKAAAIAMVLENTEVILVSDLPDELVEKAFLKTCTLRS